MSRSLLAATTALALLLLLPAGATAKLSFSGPTNYGAGARPDAVAVGDLNRDGDPDVVVANSESDNVTVRLGSARGTLGARADYFMGDQPDGVAVGDFNGDGNPDVVTANFGSDNVSLRLGDGTGALGAVATFAAGDGPISIAVGQFNRDEDSFLDVAVADWGTGNTTTDYVNVLLGNGDGTLRARSQYQVGYNPRTVSVGDITGDNDPDLAVTSELEGSAGVLAGGPGGSFGNYSWTPANWGPHGVAVADFNGDGRGDMAIANTFSSDVTMMLGAGGAATWGFFAWPVTNFATGTYPYGVVAADLDGDSRVDVATANSEAHNVSVMLGNGAGSIAAPVNFATGRRPHAIAVADFNGDAEADMAVANWDSGDVSILLNNDPPTAADDHYATDEDAPLTATPRGVLGNDHDPDGDDTLSAVAASGPAHGTLQLNANGSFTYTPDRDYHGSDSFTYRADDGSPDAATATVTIDVASIPDAPDATGDAYETGEDVALTIDAPGVLGNDRDGDGDPVSAALVSGPDHGTVTLNADGSFRYEPTADYHGPDSFGYRAGDGGLSSPPATVSITVNAVNDAPRAEDDAFATDEDTPLTVAAPGVLGNDSDIDGDALTSLEVSDPAHGSLELGANGSLTYTPDADWHGQDGFTYRASDGSASVPAQVVIDVRAVNDAPRPAPDAYTTDEDVPLAVSAAAGLLANDRDVEGDSLATTLVSGPAHGTVQLAGDGSFAYTPDGDYHGEDSFRYRAGDGSLDSDPVTVTITVTGVNDAPATGADAFATDEDAALTIAAPGVLGNDSDRDGDSLTAVAVSAPDHGSLQLNGDGSFTYTPDRDFNGTDSFRYRAADGGPDLGTATVTIDVAAVADAPHANGDAYATNEDAALRIGAPGVLGNDWDGDGDDLAAAIVSAPAHGRLVLAPDGAFVYTPTRDYSGPDSFGYRAGDGGLDSGAATVTILVKAVGDPRKPPVGAATPRQGCGLTGAVFTGTDGDDRRRGSAAIDILFGGLGDDVLRGLGGRDCLVGGAGRDRLFGGSGRDRLRGGAGRDRIDPGGGTDHVVAGPGNDRVIAWGNMGDTIDCGPGRDVAIVDRLDHTRNCERVTVR